MQNSPFPDNCRYAAIGDSITHNGWYLPFVEAYYLTRFPQQKLNVYNCGINGDTAEGGAKRYDWDIAPHRPTNASVMFAMNDVGRDLYEMGKQGVEKERLLRLNNYERNLGDLVNLLKKNQIQVVVILPTIFDDTAVGSSPHYPGLDQALGECARRAKKVADEAGCSVIDFYHPMLEVTLAQQACDPAFSLIEPDRTHPTTQGQFFMAYLFLKAQNVSAEVAQVSIKSGHGILRTTNCQVDDLLFENGSVSFRYSARALPFPLEPIKASTRGTTPWLPFMDELNREVIQIEGLPAGSYQLTIDDKPIRAYSEKELGAGVNLAIEENTPQALQSQRVWSAYTQRQELVFKLRTIACVERAAFSPESPRPATLEELEPRLAAYLKREEGSPWERAITEEVAAYRRCKNEECEMRLAVDSMLENIRTLAQPKTRQIRFKNKI